MQNDQVIREATAEEAAAGIKAIGGSVLPLALHQCRGMARAELVCHSGFHAGFIAGQVLCGRSFPDKHTTPNFARRIGAAFAKLWGI